MLEKFKLIENGAAVISLKQLLTVCMYIKHISLIIYHLCVPSVSLASSCRQSHPSWSLIGAPEFSAFFQGGSVSPLLRSDKEFVKVKFHMSPQNICGASRKMAPYCFAVKLHKCFADHETLLDFPSTRG